MPTQKQKIWNKKGRRAWACPGLNSETCSRTWSERSSAHFVLREHGTLQTFRFADFFFAVFFFTVFFFGQPSCMSLYASLLIELFFSERLLPAFLRLLMLLTNEFFFFAMGSP